MIIYPSPIFGPVHSRRLGVSLGINLMPDDGKVCTFDCIYCECGLNEANRPKHKIPTREQVAEALEACLKDMAANGQLPDVLTFAGNGEPTSHPQFADIIADTQRLRDRYCPSAKVSVLSNATNIDKSDVFEALKSIENNIQKLDTVSMDFIRLVDRPVNKTYDVQKVVEQLKRFEGHVIIQTMFLTGEGIDNTVDEYVTPWLESVRHISPEKVMIYTIDRETPVKTLRKATPEQLDAIAGRVRELGIETSVSY